MTVVETAAGETTFYHFNMFLNFLLVQNFLFQHLLCMNFHAIFEVNCLIGEVWDFIQWQMLGKLPIFEILLKNSI